MFDLGPAATEMARLVQHVQDDHLERPTPCSGILQVHDLLAHVYEFATVFTLNAPQDPVRLEGGLPDDWRTSIPARLDELAGDGGDESAWRARWSAGGIQMPGESRTPSSRSRSWSSTARTRLAGATGQDLTARDEDLAKVSEFQEVFAEPIASGQGPYGPAVTVDDASLLHQLLGVGGRDPGWTAGLMTAPAQAPAGVVVAVRRRSTNPASRARGT